MFAFTEPTDTLIVPFLLLFLQWSSVQNPVTTAKT